MDGQCHDFFEGEEPNSLASIEWQPGYAGREASEHRTLAGGEPRWLQSPEWPGSPMPGADRVILQVASVDLDPSRHPVDVGPDFWLSIEVLRYPLLLHVRRMQRLGIRRPMHVIEAGAVGHHSVRGGIRY